MAVSGDSTMSDTKGGNGIENSKSYIENLYSNDNAKLVPEIGGIFG